jgi:hypothetical protein
LRNVSLLVDGVTVAVADEVKSTLGNSNVYGPVTLTCNPRSFHAGPAISKTARSRHLQFVPLIFNTLSGWMRLMRTLSID